MKRFPVLLFADAADGGNNQPETPAAPPQTAQQVNQPQTGQVDLPPPETATPPPATRIVVEGTRTEREIALEKERDELAARARKAETDASYHADEARRLKELQSVPPQASAKKKRKIECMGFEQEVEE